MDPTTHRQGNKIEGYAHRGGTRRLCILSPAGRDGVSDEAETTLPRFTLAKLCHM
jgi:hypothetical protein